jgi:hypothetical protein
MASEPVQKAGLDSSGAVAQSQQDSEKLLGTGVHPLVCAEDGSIPCDPTGKGDKGLPSPASKVDKGL